MTCKQIIKSGSFKGQQCLNDQLLNYDVCIYHLPSNIKVFLPECQGITKGGLKCKKFATGKSFCDKHRTKYLS